MTGLLLIAAAIVHAYHYGRTKGSAIMKHIDCQDVIEQAVDRICEGVILLSMLLFSPLLIMFYLVGWSVNKIRNGQFDRRAQTLSSPQVKVKQ